MTILPPETNRKFAGIDNYEKAIVYSLLLLSSTTNKYNNSLVLNVDNENNLLRILVSLNLDSDDFFSSAGNYNAIISFSEESPIYTGDSLETETTLIPPEGIDTLEKYLVWAFKSKSLEDPACTLSYEFQNRKIKLEANINYSHTKYLANANLLKALVENVVSSQIANDIIFGNDFQLTN